MNRRIMNAEVVFVHSDAISRRIGQRQGQRQGLFAFKIKLIQTENTTQFRNRVEGERRWMGRASEGGWILRLMTYSQRSAICLSSLPRKVATFGGKGGGMGTVAIKKIE